jgi:hypothetical protein
MKPYIAAVKETISDIVDEIKMVNAAIVLRVALVGYRDFVEGRSEYTVFDFSTDITEFKKIIDASKAECPGNTDVCEDVLGGLHEVLKR